MELNDMASMTFMEDILMPFCVQSNKASICLMTKENCYIMIDEFCHLNHQCLFNYIRTKVSCPKHVPTKDVVIKPVDIFDKGSLDEKQALMLDQTLLPNISTPYIQSMKSLISPHDAKHPVLLAYLSSFGALEISIRKSSTEWKQIADISKLSVIEKENCTAFEDLQKTVNEILIDTIEWCYKIFHNTRYLLVTTKSGQLLIYAFETNEQQEINIRLSYSQQIVGLQLLKWVTSGKQEYLFTTDVAGNLNRYKIEMEGNDVKELNLVEEVPMKLKLPTSSMTATLTDKHILIVCCKSHSLEAFCFNKFGKLLSNVVQYIGLKVTGIEQLNSSMNFLVVTLDGKVFCVCFEIQNQNLTVIKKTQLQTSIQPDRYAAYGIASSKNQALFYVALYPKKNFDHLVLRQPAILQLNHFLDVSPHDMLINNPTLKLTDYYDCLELVWFMGAKDIETLHPIQNMPFDIEINEKFAYYLKLQLIVLNAKFTFYRRRSDALVEEVVGQIQFLSSLIQAVTCVRLLNFIYEKYDKKKSAPVAEIALKAAQYLRLFLRTLVDESKVPQDFTNILSELEISFNVVLNRSKSLKQTALDPCFLCQEDIRAGNFFCSAGHRTLRCSVTKLPLPLFTTNMCKHCHNAHLDLESLRIITFDNKDFMMCPLCDIPLE